MHSVHVACSRSACTTSRPDSRQATLEANAGKVRLSVRMMRTSTNTTLRKSPPHSYHHHHNRSNSNITRQEDTGNHHHNLCLRCQSRSFTYWRELAITIETIAGELGMWIHSYYHCGLRKLDQSTTAVTCGMDSSTLEPAVRVTRMSIIADFTPLRDPGFGKGTAMHPLATKPRLLPCPLSLRPQQERHLSACLTWYYTWSSAPTRASIVHLSTHLT